jgi:hypothetical protein
MACQHLQVQDIDDPIVVQICCTRARPVVVHPDRQRIELIDHIVPIEVAGQQRDRRFRGGAASCDRGGALGTQEATGGGDHIVGAGGSGQDEGAIGIGGDRRDEGVTGSIEADRDGFAGQDLSAQ